MPILPGTDGVEKMSKSLGNHVGVPDSPEEMYGRTLSVRDEAMGVWYDLLLGKPVPAGSRPRDAKRALARALVARFHGDAAARDRPVLRSSFFLAGMGGVNVWAARAGDPSRR